MVQQTISVHLEIKSQDAKSSIVQVLDTVDGFSRYKKGSATPAEILILEVGYDREREFQTLQSVLSSRSFREVFLTSEKTDAQLLLEGMRLGAREFFSQPINDEEVRAALERYRARRRDQEGEGTVSKRGKIIDVVGMKGGVGSTMLAVNLAVGLANERPAQSTALVDLNLIFGDIPLLLDIKPAHHWGEISHNISRLDATLLKSVLHVHSTGIHILPGPGQMNGFVASPDAIGRFLALMKTMYDYIVIDSGNLTEESSIKGLESADTILLVAVLTIPCLANVNRFCQLLHTLGLNLDERLKVVVNRYSKDSSVTLDDAEQTIGRKPFWTVPDDPKPALDSTNHGKSLYEIASRSPMTRSIKELALALSADESALEGKGGSFLRRLFKR